MSCQASDVEPQATLCSVSRKMGLILQQLPLNVLYTSPIDMDVLELLLSGGLSALILTISGYPWK